MSLKYIKDFKMKRYFYIQLFIVFYFFSNAIFPQSSDPIQDLYSDNNYTVFTALMVIRDQNLTQAVPALSEIITTKPPRMQWTILETLFELNDPGIYEKTLAFIARADDFANAEYPMDPLEAKVDATGILFSLKDFQTADLVMELINRHNPITKDDISAFQLLNTLVENLPQYEVEVKNKMI
jgi:hypothetical protein